MWRMIVRDYLLVSDVFRVLEWVVGAWPDIVGSGDDKVFSDAVRTLKIDGHSWGLLLKLFAAGYCALKI